VLNTISRCYKLRGYIKKNHRGYFDGQISQRISVIQCQYKCSTKVKFTPKNVLHNIHISFVRVIYFFSTVTIINNVYASGHD